MKHGCTSSNFNYLIFPSLAQDKRTKTIATDNNKVPTKWQKYIDLYVDAKSKYQPCAESADDNAAADNPDDATSSLSGAKLSCFYTKVINDDLLVFNGKIR